MQDLGVWKECKGLNSRNRRWGSVHYNMAIPGYKMLQGNNPGNSAGVSTCLHYVDLGFGVLGWGRQQKHPHPSALQGSPSDIYLCMNPDKSVCTPTRSNIPHNFVDSRAGMVRLKLRV